MSWRSLLFVPAALAWLSGCASQAPRDSLAEEGPRLMPAAEVRGDFAATSAVAPFIERMHERHGFAPAELGALLSQAEREQWIIDLMDRQAPSGRPSADGGWNRYRAKFLTPQTIEGGLQFWARHASTLERASARYGVPPQYIVAILGIETRYGGYVGDTRILDALATLAFAYPRRADYFTDELESFLVMSREEGVDPRVPRGSYAGAMGLGQFMPSSFLRYAVDFDGDGRRDLWNPTDAIGSVAHYFQGHGWRAGEPVAVPAELRPGASARAFKTGFDTRYSPRELEAGGVVLPALAQGAGAPSLLGLDTLGADEYWLGFENFRVITRYNRSTYYAMAVHQLGETLRERRGVAPSVRLSGGSGRSDDALL